MRANANKIDAHGFNANRANRANRADPTDPADPTDRFDADRFDSDRIKLLMELRRQGITDARTLSAIERTPRDHFVPLQFRARAWENQPLPIECGQTISQPFVVAYMTEALEITDRCTVLEIGAGSGYQAAVLALLARRVYTIERYPFLYRRAIARLRQLGLQNVIGRLGDGTRGWADNAPFDRIILTAAAEDPPGPLLEQLKVGGIMIAPVDASGDEQQLVRVRRVGKNEFDYEALIPVRFVPLVEKIAIEKSEDMNTFGW